MPLLCCRISKSFLSGHFFSWERPLFANGGGLIDLRYAASWESRPLKTCT